MTFMDFPDFGVDKMSSLHTSNCLVLLNLSALPTAILQDITLGKRRGNREKFAENITE